MRTFLDIDGIRRMETFRTYDIGKEMRTRVEEHSRDHRLGTFKSTSFLKEDIKYALSLSLEPDLGPGEAIVMSNPSGESERRVNSYIKYILRSHGILYHCLPDTSPTILQIVLPLPTPSLTPLSPPLDKPEGWISGLFKRSSSVPPNETGGTPPKSDPKQKQRYLTCYLRIQFEGQSPKRTVTSRASSRTGRASHVDSTIASGAMAALTTLVEAQHMDLDTAIKRSGDKAKRSVSHARPPLSRMTTVNRTVSLSRVPSTKTSHPHPLSRQVSTESVTTRSNSGSGVSRNTSINTQRRDAPVSRVIITLSDTRAYPIMRKALDVKLDHPEGTRSPIIVGRELPPPLSADTSPEMEERGRRRSKEDKLMIEILDEDKEGLVTPEGSRERSRGRKVGGFLEGLWGKDKSRSRSGGKGRRGRSISTPPGSVWSGTSLYTPVGM
jgi:hypothetical protein